MTNKQHHLKSMDIFKNIQEILLKTQAEKWASYRDL